MAALAPPRQVSIIKPTTASRQGGVLQASPTLNTNRTPNTPYKGRDVRLKVVVRRLAPGLTEEEFRQALGEEWRSGGKKVDWTSYEQGKASKDFAKPSRPSRAYFHLTNAQFLGPLAEKVRTTQFIDAKGTSNDVVLLGPPTLATTPFNKVPPKARSDGRQGTIDQDPEFIEFLTSLTIPLVKPANVDSATDKEKSSDTKIITPLVQFIKDKKANKGKDARAQKHGRHESKDNPTKPEEKKNAAKNAKGKASSIDQSATAQPKADKIKQKASAKTAKQSQATTAPTTSAPAAPTIPTAPAAQITAQAAVGPQPKPERRRERGNASLAAQILQRDLGLANGGQGRRKREAPNPSTDGNSQAAVPSAVQSGPSSSNPVVSPQTTPSTSPAPPQAPAGPNTSRKAQPNNTPAQQRRPTPTKPSAAATSTATQAFLKHANPSQGITEPLLDEAFKTFGRVTKVEIDKKKGFAYIDFAEPDGLQKAIAASPVKVGQGQVVVLERKSNTVLQNRNVRGPQDNANSASPANRGGRGGGRGRGGKSHANQSKAANIVPATNPTPVAVTAPT